MTDRERLIELIRQAKTEVVCYGEPATKWQRNIVDRTEANDLADYLLANGVIVPMCYIGQPIWYVCEHIYSGTVEIKEGKISMIQQKTDKSWKFRITVNSSVWDFTPDKIGASYFLTKEEAEAELKKRGKENG